MNKYVVRYTGPQYIEVEASNSSEAEALAEQKSMEYWNWTADESLESAACAEAECLN